MVSRGEEHEAEGVLEQDAELNYIFVPNMDETEAGENCISSGLRPCTSRQKIVRVIKFKRMRWVGHVARAEEKPNT
jgi:hypothetical protein